MKNQLIVTIFDVQHREETTPGNYKCTVLAYKLLSHYSVKFKSGFSTTFTGNFD